MDVCVQRGRKSHWQRKGKEKWKEPGGRKEEKEEKTIVLLSGFILATFEMAKTTTLDRRGLFGGDIFKNPARYNDACIKNIMIVVTS